MLFVEADLSSLLSVEKTLRTIGNQAPHAIRRAVNHTGDKMVTAVARSLAKQTSVKYGTVKKAMRVQRASFDQPTFRISIRGGYLSLKEFSPRQTRRGVSALVWGKRRVYPHTFISRKLGGHVFVRAGKGRLPLHKVWGPALPAEMVKAETAAMFLATVSTELPARVAHEIAAIIAGHAPRG